MGGGVRDVKNGGHQFDDEERQAYKDTASARASA
jgi:hypothetical protein